MRVGIVDFEGGNVSSVANALQHVGAPIEMADDPRAFDAYSHLVLPGVGSFQETMKRLSKRKMDVAIRRYAENQRGWLLGICVGMQVLADRGEEFGECGGLGLISASVTQVDTSSGGDRLPHMGWNDVAVRGDCPLFSGMDEPVFYFVHSFRIAVSSTDDATVAWCDYGAGFCAAVQSDNVFGVQFHPEKSQSDGLRLLRNFLDLPG